MIDIIITGYYDVEFDDFFYYYYYLFLFRLLSLFLYDIIFILYL